jgi:hypothetical protein
VSAGGFSASVPISVFGVKPPTANSFLAELPAPHFPRCGLRASDNRITPSHCPASVP